MTVYVPLTIVEGNKVAVIAWATSNERWNAMIYQVTGTNVDAPDLLSFKHYATRAMAEKWARKVLSA